MNLNKHSIHTAVHNICPQISKDLKNLRPPQRIVAVALDMSKAFGTMNIHKLTLTNFPKTIIKFKSNYIKGQ